MRTYSEYKNTDIEWLDKIPTHWESVKLKETVSDCINGKWGQEEQGTDKDIICIRVADFDRDRLIIKKNNLTKRYLPENKKNNHLLKYGDLLLEKSGGGENQPVGAVVLYNLKDKEAICSNFIGRMPVKENYESKYLTYLNFVLYSMGVNKKSIKQTTGIQNLDAKQYLNEFVAIPKKEEQQKIAKYLDIKTEDIDGLIDKKEKLIELLKKKRTALITDVVTKGLDHEVEMKDSGIEWLEKIPRHWKEVKLKETVSDCINGKWGDEKKGTNKDIICVRVADFDRNKLVIANHDLTKRYLPEDKANNHLLKYGDLLLEKSGGGENQPVGAVIFYNLKEKVAICSNFIGRMPAKENYDSKYLTYLNFTLYHMGVNKKSIKQTTGIQNLDAKQYLNETVAIPKKKEQQNIAKYLNKETEEIDNLITKIEEAIKKLKEYRTALITNSVTGKIDVRGEV